MLLIDNFYLKPENLHNIFQSLNDEIENKCKDFCSQDIGYITKFKGIKKIRDNHINRCGNRILFLVEYEVDNFKPEEGIELNATISGIFEDGLLLTYIDKIRILVTKQNLIDNGYIFENNTYNELNIGDNINIVVDKIRYVKSRFDCIANLKV